MLINVTLKKSGIQIKRNVFVFPAMKIGIKMENVKKNVNTINLEIKKEFAVIIVLNTLLGTSIKKNVFVTKVMTKLEMNVK